MSKPIPTTCPHCGKPVQSTPLSEGKVRVTCTCGQLNEVIDQQGRKLLIDGPQGGVPGRRMLLG